MSVATKNKSAAAVPPVEQGQADAPARQSALRALMDWLAQPVHFFVAACSLMPLAFLVLFVLARGVNTPLLDQWENNLIIAIKTANGSLTLADVLRQNYDHRLFFSNLLTIISTVFTHWNLKFEMLVVVATGAANALLLILLFKEHESKALPLVLIPFAALMLSLRQNSIWLWSMLISPPLSVTFLLLGLYTLKKMPVGWKGLGLAAFFATCMVLCVLQGFLGFPLLFAAMWLLGYRKWQYYAVWVAIAVVVGVLYFTNYEFGLLGANEDGNSAGLVKDPIRIFLYSIAYLGSPFVVSAGNMALPASIIGVSGLALMVANGGYLWRAARNIRSIGAWVIVGLFGVGSAVFTALGRGHVYPELIPHQPLIDRYVTPPSVLWCVVIALGALVVWRALRNGDKHPIAVWLTRINVVVFVPLIGLYLFANVTQLGRAGVVPQDQNQPACVVAFPATRNLGCLDFLYLKQSNLADIAQRIDQMSIYQLADFAGREPLFSSAVSLHAVPREAREINGIAGFRLFEFRTNPTFETIVFMQHAPGQVEFSVDVPQTDEGVDLVTGVFVDRSNLGDTSLPQDGVTFRVGVRYEDGSTDLLAEETVNPNIDDWFKPLKVNLDALKGRSVRLIFQTDERANANYDWSMWIDPVMITRPRE